VKPTEPCSPARPSSGTGPRCGRQDRLPAGVSADAVRTGLHRRPRPSTAGDAAPTTTLILLALPDLAAILLTGIPAGLIPGFQNNTGTVQADQQRLHMAIPPTTHAPSNLGLIGKDPCRRCQDLVAEQRIPRLLTPTTA